MALGLGTRNNNGGSGASPMSIASFAVSEVSPLIVTVLWQGVQTVSSVTWNTSEALSLIDSATAGSGTNLNKAIYGIKNPTATTATITVTFSANPSGGGAIYAIATTGGDTTTGWRTASKRTDTDGAGPGLTLANSQNGDIVFDAIAMVASSITWDGGETTTSTTISNIDGGGLSGGVSTKPATGADTVVGATDASAYAQVVVALIPGGSDISTGLSGSASTAGRGTAVPGIEVPL